MVWHGADIERQGAAISSINAPGLSIRGQSGANSPDFAVIPTDTGAGCDFTPLQAAYTAFSARLGPHPWGSLWSVSIGLPRAAGTPSDPM